MEHLIIDLKENLINRRKNEVIKIEELSKEGFKDLILIFSGKIFELDSIIKTLDELIIYIEKTKQIQ
ncbi:MAG: hypothetical protein IPF54_02570 [Draconibacterium sp.]|nr:hypothetical protein [Draconibacterium sp.]